MDELEKKNLEKRAPILMNRVLDGEASPLERKELDRLLALSPTRAAEYQEFATISEIFRGAPRAEASPDFGEQVMRRVFESPFRTEVWPQLMPVIRRLAMAASVLIILCFVAASVEAVRRPMVLFHPNDPPGMTPLRTSLSDLGRRILLDSEVPSGAGITPWELLREYTQVAGSRLAERSAVEPNEEDRR